MPKRALVLVTTLLLGASLLTAPAGARSPEGEDAVHAAEPYLVGRGVADATGEIAEVGLMGYGRIDQQAAGLHNRQRSRAFVIADRETNERVLLIVVDAPMIFNSVRQEVLRRLAERYGDTYTERNVMLTATHSHAAPGGHSHHLLYNLTTLGFHRKTFEAVTSGIVESAERAHADLAPASLTLTHDELTDASANRSRTAFDRNPDGDKAHFPDAVDPQTSLLRIERDGRPVGAINWFPVHATSMSGDNRLVSSDNKGYAAYRWERQDTDVDYRGEPAPEFVSAFAQTNAGDLTPNLDLTPPTTPEDFGRTTANGEKQYRAAKRQLTAKGANLAGGVDSRLVHINLSDVEVRPEFTGDGRTHRTCSPAVGAAMAAGSVEDGPAFPGFDEGENPLWDRVSHSVLYRASPELKECQAPKGVFAPVGAMNKVYPWVQEIVPVQLVRVGELYLIGVPGEVTITAGLRLRRTVAEAVGADLRNVLVAGYANSYFHYLTTPEEYDVQHYEGGSTLFGRWQLPAMQQTAHGLATAMRDGREVPSGDKPEDLSGKQFRLQPGVVLDTPPVGKRFGDVLSQPAEVYSSGEQVSAAFAGAHPSNDLHRGGTYLEVQRWDGHAWRTVADDGDWSTRLHWKRRGLSASQVTITWEPPADAAGTYRIRYRGDAKNALGRISPITGVTREFTIR
ncbi:MULTISPECIES: neutral/alkaline ceramidase [Prauserella salsuginis group]|uniref:Neutral ceramidase n=1 Tax=Prauserella salsuginis TaxID=387889 RepID=A0ABW6G9A3_9PSEU|nr:MULTISPECIES: neutral/alkaline ceramidase [Prauserella salsuginis group]MCR3719491.1 neutral ceramidase [Prauserella flava]MCR3735495.1 neutral ceramidase [Prauserella salsuginis]